MRFENRLRRVARALPVESVPPMLRGRVQESLRMPVVAPPLVSRRVAFASVLALTATGVAVFFVSPRLPSFFGARGIETTHYVNGFGATAHAIAQDREGNVLVRMRFWFDGSFSEQNGRMRQGLVYRPVIGVANPDEPIAYVGFDEPLYSPRNRDYTDLWLAPLEPPLPGQARPKVLRFACAVGPMVAKSIGNNRVFTDLSAEDKGTPKWFQVSPPEPVDDLGYDNHHGPGADNLRLPRNDAHRAIAPTMRLSVRVARALLYNNGGFVALGVPTGWLPPELGDESSFTSKRYLMQRAVYWFRKASDEAGRIGDSKTAKRFYVDAVRLHNLSKQIKP